jgi:importin-4
MAVAAKRLLSKNKWNELLQFIYQYSQSEMEDQRELAFIILNELAETLGKSFEGQFTQLKQVYHVALTDGRSRKVSARSIAQSSGEAEKDFGSGGWGFSWIDLIGCLTHRDPHPPSQSPDPPPTPIIKVQVASLKACAALLMHLVTDDASAIMQDLVPGMLQVARGCLEQGEEEIVAQVLDVFSELASTSTSVLTPTIPQVVHFCLEVLKQDGLQSSTQDVAGMVIMALAEEKPKSLGKKGLVPDMVATLLHMMAVSQDNAAGELLSTFDGRDEEEDEEDDYDGPSGQDIAQRCLDAMAIHVPTKYFYQPTMALIGQGLDSADFNMRKAGTAALAVIIEGCHEEIDKHLPSILPRVFAAARDPAVCVRECACFVLGQLSEYCQPQILDYHGEILPVIFTLLEDATLSVQLTGCHVLETFCEHLSKDVIAPYLQPLLARLHQLLQAPKTSVQEAAIGAIAATAVGAEDAFTPYLHQIAPLMAQILPVTDERLLRMKGRAMDCMGRMATAVGQQHFAPFLDVSMQAAVQSFALDSLSLKEDAYLFLAQMVSVLKEGFAPHLAGLVPQICAVLEESEGEIVWVDDEEDEANGVARLVDGVDDDEEEGADDDSDARTRSSLGSLSQRGGVGAGAVVGGAQGGEEEDEDDSDYEDGTPVYDVHTGMLDVKKAAAYCMGELAQHTGAHYAPYIEMSLKQLHSLKESFNSMLREEVASVLPHLVVSATLASPPSRAWAKADFTDTLSPATRAVCSAVLAELLGLVQDEDQDVATACYSSLQACLEHVGPCLLAGAPEREQFMTALLQVFQEQLPSQKALEDEEDGLDDDDEGGARDLMEAACDLAGATAKTLGAAFVPYLDKILEPLCGFTKATRTEGHRQAASGCLGEIAEGLGPDAKRYFPALFPVVKLCLTDRANAVKRNAAWCLGMLCQALGPEVQPYLPEVLQALHPLFALAPGEDGGAETTDNAVGAVARLIMAAPAAVPMAAVLPVFLQALPLKADKAENEAVYKCLLQLVQAQHPDLAAHANILRALLGHPELPPEYRDVLAQHLQ